jgi:hypothetical protein
MHITPKQALNDIPIITILNMLENEAAKASEISGRSKPPKKDQWGPA